MTAIGKSISFGALILAVAGCGGPRFNYEGTWRGTRKLAVVPGTDPGVAVQLQKVQVSVFGNDRFEMALNGLFAKGAVSYPEGKALLTPDQILDEPIDRQPPEIQKLLPQAKLVPAKDGTVRFEVSGEEPVRMERIATVPQGRA